MIAPVVVAAVAVVSRSLVLVGIAGKCLRQPTPYPPVKPGPTERKPEDIITKQENIKMIIQRQNH